MKKSRTKKPATHRTSDTNIVDKATLDRAYELYHREFYRDHDPVGLVHRYKTPRDQEVAGLATALLSYGNVTSIRRSAEKILAALGPRPAEFLHDLRWPAELDGFYHRFTKAEDFKVLFHRIGIALRASGSLENHFLAASPPGTPMQARLSAFVRSLETAPLSPELERIRAGRARNLKYLVSDPLSGAACKRLNMYLRWMIRPADGIDLGAWPKARAHELILPIDTHVLKTLQKLRWTRSKTANWKVAEAATERLREYCPEDPVKYDFSLCHLSMHGQDIASF